MSIEGIIGVALTIIFGVVSVILAGRKKKYPKRMEFYVLDNVRIISPLVRKYDSIKLLHNDKDIQNVSFLRGMCLCVGDEDVILTSDSLKGGLQLSLPRGYKWLEVHPQECSNGLEIKCIIDEKAPNNLFISSKLFKREEAFTFDAYIEGDVESRLLNDDIKISHRLNNAEKMLSRQINILNVSRKKSKLWFNCIMLVLYILLFATIYMEYYDRPVRYVEKTNSKTIYSVSLVGDSLLAVSNSKNGVLPWDNTIVPIQEFNDKFTINCKVSEKTIGTEIVMLGLPIVMLLLFIIILVLRFIEYRRLKKVIDTYVKIIKDSSEIFIDK